MPEDEYTIIKDQQETGDNSEISREEIARSFSKHCFLDQDYINALKQLRPREAFSLLI